ncbi:MAG: glycosyl transferase family 1 [Deltaproteobacteria bacterium]|jgi:glycosyltransferase involved in cell wall biosynthesis|nr:glycosyl transferase family 1 [Deltaproteobacteria bacterium]
MSGVSVTVVGHPFAPIGMGEHIRATFRALRSVGVDAHLHDVYGINDPALVDTGDSLRPYLARRITTDVRIFVLNGDERQHAFAHMGEDVAGGGYQIVYPAWELSNYPKEWGEQLDLYDEVWAASQFSRAAFAKTVHKPVHHLPLPGQPVITRLLSRRYFGLPDNAYMFLFFFDVTSYIERKNPFAVISAFERLCQLRPYDPVVLVIKVGSKSADPHAMERLVQALEPIKRRTVLLDRTLTDNEVKNLVRCCDCFVSLHRAEGFGFGMIEAMYFGKPVVATAYSGNCDYMNADTACLVDYDLVAVQEGQYPHGQGQVWAEPNVDQATSSMLRLVDDREFGRGLGRRASAHIRTGFSYRAAGLRYLQRIEEILHAGAA